MVDEPEKNDGKQIAISHRIVCVSTHHASTLSATLGWQALDGKDGLISQVSPYVSWFIIPINYRYITNQNHIVAENTGSIGLTQQNEKAAVGLFCAEIA